MFNSILVVCTGNVCRSPIGERYLKRAMPEKHIGSAGTGALVGHEADVNAVKIANNYNLLLTGHKGKQYTAALGREYDLILVMEKKHLEQIEKISPEVRGKTMLFGHWLNQRDIPDPYGKSEEAFSLIYELITQAAQTWVDKLS